jgi:hypothetical protein
MLLCYFICGSAVPSLLRSGFADLVNFLTTLYDMIFWWWSYTCNSGQNVSIEHEFSFKALNLSLQTLMPWNSLTPAHYVGCVA